MDRPDLRRAVVQRHVGAAAADVRRVRLELHEQPVHVPGRHVPERQQQVAVTARLPDRARLDRVLLGAFVPAGGELQRGALEIAVRGEREPRLPEQAAAQVGRGIQLERGRGRPEPDPTRPLSEDVGKAEHEEQREGAEERPAQGPVVGDRLQVPVLLEDDRLWDVRHRAGIPCLPEMQHAPPTRSALTGDYMVTYYDRRGRRPRVQGPRRPDATASPRPALRARRPHAHRARVGAGDDALRGHEAPACSRRRRARGHAAAGPGEAALPQPGPDPSRPRPLDRQVHGAPRLGARGSQERTGGDCMTTMTAQTTQVYSIFIKATPEQIWDAITKPEFSHKYFYGSYVTVTPEAYRGLDGEGGDLVIGTVLEYEPPARLVHSWSAMYDAEVAGED